MRRYYFEVICYPEGFNSRARIFSLNSRNTIISSDNFGKFKIISSFEKKCEISVSRSFIRPNGEHFPTYMFTNTSLLSEANEILDYPIEFCDSVICTNWICPACREICKCSQCRKSRTALGDSHALEKKLSCDDPTLNVICSRQSIDDVPSVESELRKRRSRLEDIECLVKRKILRIPEPHRLEINFTQDDTMLCILFHHIFSNNFR